jgi:hypothetical protein
MSRTTTLLEIATLPAMSQPEGTSFLRVHAAFVAGDLEALRQAIDDPAQLPNGWISDAVGSSLVYAIYHSPLAFIRTMLEMGADANAPAADGFPPLIAALSTAGDVRGAPRRPDVDEVLRLLLSFGADPNQRGINDYTALHMAVVARRPLAVQLLLERGADPALATRIDDYETPLQLAQISGYADIAGLLVQAGRPLEQRLRAGLTLMADVRGDGAPVRRQHEYRVRLRLSRDDGRPIRFSEATAPMAGSSLDDDGATLVTTLRINRGSIIAGLFYGVEGMCVGGWRRLRMEPHLAYGDGGIPGIIPSRAALIAEIAVLDATAPQA